MLGALYEATNKEKVMMRHKRVLPIIFLGIFFLVGCVSKNQYQQLETTQRSTQQMLEEKQRELEKMTLRLEDSEARREACSKELSALQKRHEDLVDTNLTLSRKVENLSRDLERKRSTIHEQKKVIKTLDETKRRIETTLKDEVEAQRVKIEEMEGKLKVTFIDKILFDTGSVAIKKKGKELLLGISGSLREDKSHKILVEGHTDNVPIGIDLMKKFPTNWELSTARAAAVVRYLQGVGGLEPERLSACGYGQYRPVAGNDTEEGRRQNRRIELILVPLE
jgi:chemotaxis protein MotB